MAQGRKQTSGGAGKRPGAQGGRGSKGSRGSKGASTKALSAARRSTGARSNRMQYIIGGAAIVIIAVIIAVGVMMNVKSTEVQEADYGDSVSSTATVSDGIITVSNGDPDKSIDVYEDALCPYCRILEEQHGQEMAKAVDEGELVINYRMVDFLNGLSASGDYSTRAAAALYTVAVEEGDVPGLVMNMHAALFDERNQPEERGSSDWSNKDLAEMARIVGASEGTQQKIADGVYIDEAASGAEANMEALREAAAKVGRGAGTPTVTVDGVPISTDSSDWLRNIIDG